MRKLVVVFLAVIAGMAATRGRAQPASGRTPAEASIAEAEHEITAHPTSPSGYNQLALALLRRARETSDASYVQRAEDAVNKSLQLDANNFESHRTEVSILLAEHEYPAALDKARTLNKRVADDVLTYGLVSVASSEIGNYSEAEEAGQWMLNLRPGNSPALVNTGYLREFFGDPDGAFQVLSLALEATAPSETENRAWILTRMAHMRLVSGKPDVADALLQQSLAAFPNYREALGVLAQVRLAQRRYAESIALLQQAEPVPVRAANLYVMAQALELGGRKGEAEHAYQEFEAKAKAESGSKDNANRDLILYYADHTHQPAKAVELARQELSWRHDVYTLDAYAWALHSNGQNGEAQKQIDTALAVGIRDATIFRHAGEIALKLGDAAAAMRDFEESADLSGPDAERSRVMLKTLRSRKQTQLSSFQSLR